MTLVFLTIYVVLGAFFAVCGDQAILEEPEIYYLIEPTPLARAAIAAITVLSWPILVLAMALR